jgi:hypothetical protein
MAGTGTFERGSYVDTNKSPSYVDSTEEYIKAQDQFLEKFAYYMEQKSRKANPKHVAEKLSQVEFAKKCKEEEGDVWGKEVLIEDAPWEKFYGESCCLILGRFVLCIAQRGEEANLFSLQITNRDAITGDRNKFGSKLYEGIDEAKKAMIKAVEWARTYDWDKDQNEVTTEALEEELGEYKKNAAKELEEYRRNAAKAFLEIDR